MAEAVFFDWDGTLFDVFDFLVDTYTKVFQNLGLEPWSRTQYRNEFRCDWKSMLSEMGLDEHMDYLVSVWETEKGEKGPELKLHEGALDCIQQLHGKTTLGIISSAPKDILSHEVARFDVEKYMDVIFAFDDTEKNKPDPEPLLRACAVLGKNPEKCVYVGDMVEDVQSANAAGMHSIAVSWGIHSPQNLSNQNPDYMAHSFKDLLTHLNGLE